MNLDISQKVLWTREKDCLPNSLNKIKQSLSAVKRKGQKLTENLLCNSTLNK